MPTLTTLPLLILIMVLWRYTRGRILSIVLFTSIFDAASALNFGAMGVSPWLFALVLCLGYTFLKGRQPLRPRPGVNAAAFSLTFAFIAYAVFTGIVYPFLFEGIAVTRATTLPLQWTFSNLAQICYLLAAAVVYLLAVCSSPEDLQSAVDWYIRGCVVAGLIAVYQLANSIFHIPYPDALFYSNKAHVVYHAYKINGMWRLNSTFTEASEMAGFLTAGLAMLAWKLMKEPLRWRSSLSFCLLLASVLMTLSSTGYVCLIFIALVGGVLYSRHLVRSRAVSRVGAMLAIFLVFGLTTFFSLNDTASQSVIKVVDSTLIGKQNTDSYRERVASHQTALRTLADTYYMGAGWGSIRSSGLVYMLLGTVGVFGLALFSALNISLYLPLFDSPRLRTSPARLELLSQSLFGISVLLVAHVIAGSEPTIPILWVLFGAASAAVSRGTPTPHRELVAFNHTTPGRRTVAQFMVPSATPEREA